MSLCIKQFFVVIGWRNDQTAIVKKQSFDVTKVVLTKFISGSENCPGFGENFRVVKFVILKVSTIFLVFISYLGLLVM